VRADPHLLFERRRQVLTDVVGPDRQLAVTPVDQHRQLDGPGAAERVDRIEGRANRASREQHVVDEDHQPAGDPARRLNRLRQRPHGMQAQVVAIEGGVDRADARWLGPERSDAVAQAASQVHAPGRDAEQHHARAGFGGRFDDLMGDAIEGASHVGGVEHLHGLRVFRAHSSNHN
jgi:hypothetical protein